MKKMYKYCGPLLAASMFLLSGCGDTSAGENTESLPAQEGKYSVLRKLRQL